MKLKCHLYVRVPVILLFMVFPSLAADPILPDGRMTPGVALTNVTVEQICHAGYAKSVRNVSEATKRAVFIEYFGKVPNQPGNYEIDHLISLELGGSNHIRNLWPQSYTTEPWNSHVKDRLEDRMAFLVRQQLQMHGMAAAHARIVDEWLWDNCGRVADLKRQRRES